jgi:aspartate/methionine/tyrosine aminotransferase
MTISNPTLCGFKYPRSFFESLLTGNVEKYSPNSQGLLIAREAVSQDLQRQGLSISPENIFLTSGTSEAYSYLFKLLCDPGDSVLFPSPGYPLIEHLAQAESLEALPYWLIPRTNGAVDFDSFGLSNPEKVKAIVGIHPHNPLGTYLSHDDLARMDDWCSQRGAALLLDEVFWDYAWDEPPTRPSFEPKSLTVHLGGLSKSVGLPQLKCSWFALRGPKELLEHARIRLDFLLDLYLSVGSPVQNALPLILRNGSVIQDQILKRIKSNRHHLEEIAPTWNGRIHLVPSQAAWASILEVTNPTLDEETYTMELLESGVYVMPGYFFSLDGGVHFVISLLIQEADFQKGLSILTSYFTK